MASDGEQRGNPFSPGFGRSPAELVGRDALLDELRSEIEAASSGHRLCSILLGVRGSGKTSVLNAAEDLAHESGWMVLALDTTTRGLPQRIARAAAAATSADAVDLRPRRRINSLRLPPGIALGWECAESISDEDPRYLLSRLAETAAARGGGLLVTLDELHSGERDEVRRFASDFQHTAEREGLPIGLLGAALPEIQYTVLEDRKLTFFHRATLRRLQPLTAEQSFRCLRATAAGGGGAFEADALCAAAGAVNGSPYHLQLLGRSAWEAAGAPEAPIDAAACQLAIREAGQEFRRSISEPAWNDLSDAQQDYLHAIARLHPSATRRAVAGELDAPTKWLARTERRLTISGYVRMTDGDTLEFAELTQRQDVLDFAEPESGYRRPADHPNPQRARFSEATRPCGEWMPVAKARCALGRGHKGGHRTRR
ncbi:MAG: ATP-binding protein [bacterium]|nr:ATP-binding protein [bacterium]MDE0669775.1 ATP-binding protein [bacterium]MXZ30072.1 ATP-binding protein [Acidimicrobiia bacterium]MYE68194.1 ATP-binding protein [Acidimicrobiia bacterium]MYJ12758.1 ATP-binding protein [Acidimicrobiia bacterium]